VYVGYSRISTIDQNADLQHDALKAASCKKYFTDKASGAKAEREALQQALEFVRPGDTLVVWRLDRLGRSLPHLIQTINQLQDKEVGFKSLTENIDTTTPTGTLVFHIFGAIAEFERDLIRERTQAGLASARARGRVGGRPKGGNTHKQAMARKLYADKTNTIQDICHTLSISRATLYRYVRVNVGIAATPASIP
jgi:DNA invertase Pin-like site-specific DNA recombinase